MVIELNLQPRDFRFFLTLVLSSGNVTYVGQVKNRPERITMVKQRLQQIHVGGMTILDATGWSKQREFHLQWRGQEIASDLVPKVKLEVVIPDSQVDSVIEAITESAKTEEGEHGDGVIFVFTVEEAVNISTAHKGEKVVS